MLLLWLRPFYQGTLAIMAATTLLMACQTPAGKNGSSSFNPDFSTNVTKSELSVEQQVQQRELEGYVAQTSARSHMRLPKDLDLALSGALKKPKKVEFTDPDVEYPSHLSPYKLTDYAREVHYRPIFNDRFNVSGSIR